VTSITDIDTRHAKMVAYHTMEDVIAACHEGYVDQSNAPPNVCISRNRKLLKSAPLVASADCAAAVITIDGEAHHMPMHADCASGGIQAIKAFKTLCPSYGGTVEVGD
jgi:hypothetical protein